MEAGLSDLFTMQSDTSSFLSPHAALERQMGLSSNGPAPMEFDGQIADDDDDSPAGRQAVQYGGGGDDGLFSPDAAMPTAAAAAPPAQEEEVDASADGADGGLDAMSAALLGVLGDPSGALGGDGGSANALLAQLEAMADEFEQQSGQPETEIRGKIAMLRSVLGARPAAVASQRARMESALSALGGADDADDNHQPAGQAAAAAMRGEGALHSGAAAGADNLEAELGRVDTMLRADPDAAAMVGSIMSSAAQHK